jgi:gliding motility-associated lipoprotein GldB
MNRFYIPIFILLAFVSCNPDTKKDVDVSNIKVNVVVDRFEQQFYTATKETLPKLEQKYPYLFPIKEDSIWLKKINTEQELYQKSQKIFGDFKDEKAQVNNLFKHVKYYFPTFKSPKIITLITNLDYESKVIYADSLLFVSLDMYLGTKDKVYDDFPKYLKQNYNKTQLVVDVAKAISDKYYRPKRERIFLNNCIDEGKKKYVLDVFLPTVSDAKKMGYTKDQLEWAEANELPIWSYFMEKDLLFSSSSTLYKRFIADAPFSKFYLNIDDESPGRLGSWIGWQIVRSYMKNNDVTLQQLLQTKAEEIFKKSKYKPHKNGNKAYL